MIELIADIIGYLGMGAILYGIHNVRCEDKNVKVDVVMTLGQLAIAINSIVFGAYPPFVLNTIGAILNLNNLRKDLKK